MTSRNLRLGRSFWFAVALLLMGCGIAQAQELEGSWRLVMRKLPDGTTQTPPAVLGAYTIYKGLQNLNVFWHTPDGKPAFVSRISTYKLSGTGTPRRCWSWHWTTVAANQQPIISREPPRVRR